MPRRKRKSRVVYRYLKTKRRYKRRVKMKVGDVVVGTAIATFTEPFLDGLMDKFMPMEVAGFDLKDVGKVMLGMWLTKQRSGIVKSSGYALAVIGTRNLVRSFVGTKLAIPEASSSGW